MKKPFPGRVPSAPKRLQKRQGIVWLVDVLGFFAGFGDPPLKETDSRNQAASMPVGVFK